MLAFDTITFFVVIRRLACLPPRSELSALTPLPSPFFPTSPREEEMVSTAGAAPGLTGD